MTEVASGVQASASKLVIISKRFCFKYLASAARRSQIWLPHCLLRCFSLIFASLGWSCCLTAAPVPCPRAVWSTGPAFTLLLCFSWINITEIAFLRDREKKNILLHGSIRAYHLNFTLTKNTKKCLHFLLFSPENPPILYSLSVKLS